jgi:hypothetical protein
MEDLAMLVYSFVLIMFLLSALILCIVKRMSKKKDRFF